MIFLNNLLLFPELITTPKYIMVWWLVCGILIWLNQHLKMGALTFLQKHLLTEICPQVSLSTRVRIMGVMIFKFFKSVHYIYILF